MNKIIAIIEIAILILVTFLYVVPNWLKPGLSFSDLFVLESFYLIGSDLYKQLKDKV